MSFERGLRDDGFVFVRAGDMRAALESAGPLGDWRSFAESWNDLEVDRYLADRGRYRRRRYAMFSIDAAGAIARKPHGPHYQGRQYNQLFGGIERWFEPIRPDVADGESLQTILHWTHRLFSDVASAQIALRYDLDPIYVRSRSDLDPICGWHVEVHQFRIEARPDEPGQPTPEGAHRDGVDYVLVLLIDRQNIVSGTTTVFDLDGKALGSFTLTDPCDAALVDDNRVAHGVTPVAPLDPAAPAHRDVLVVTFRRAS